MVIAVLSTSKAVLKLKHREIQAWARFEPMTSAIPVQYSTNWTIKLGAGYKYNQFRRFTVHHLLVSTGHSCVHIFRWSFVYSLCRWIKITTCGGSNFDFTLNTMICLANSMLPPLETKVCERHYLWLWRWFDNCPLPLGPVPGGALTSLIQARWKILHYPLSENKLSK